MNAFSIFGLEPGPCINADEIKTKFLESSASLHPDAGNEQTSGAFADLNQAYRILLSDHLRLKHLLELCGLGDPGAISAVPGHLGDLFMEAGGLMSSADRLLKARNRAEGILEQASLQPELLEKIEQLQEFLSGLLSRRNHLREQLEIFGRSWENNPATIGRLKEFYLEFSYLDKWIEQAQEKAFLLSSS